MFTFLDKTKNIVGVWSHPDDLPDRLDVTLLSTNFEYLRKILVAKHYCNANQDG